MDAYSAALRQVIGPESVVLDIGTGTGIMALLACQFGASRVYAVDPNPLIQVGRETAALNAVADRIEFLPGVSTEQELPEPVDIAVSDLRGVLPPSGTHICSIIDARERFLKPGGALVPQTDWIWAAVVEVEEYYRGIVEPWRRDRFGMNLEPARLMAVNSWSKCALHGDQLLTRPCQWARLDYQRVSQADVAGELTWSIKRKGVAHGFALWFTTNLFGEVGFSTAPGQPGTVYGQGFFPFSDPVPVADGDGVTVSLRADLVGPEYVWSWSTRVSPVNGDVSPTAFHQSSFFAEPLLASSVHRKEYRVVPTLNESGVIQSFALGLIDGENSLETVAQRLADRFPHRFSGLRSASNWLVDLLQRVGA